MTPIRKPHVPRRARAVLGSLAAVIALAAVATPAQAFFDCKGGRAFALRSIRMNKWVTAEFGSQYTGGWRGLLRARGDAIGAWERFSCVSASGDRTFIKSLHNGKWVTVERSWTAGRNRMLRARGDERGTWQTFYVTPIGNTGKVVIKDAIDRWYAVPGTLPDHRWGALSMMPTNTINEVHEYYVKWL